jgi:hypothetical protein
MFSVVCNEEVYEDERILTTSIRYDNGKTVMSWNPETTATAGTRAAGAADGHTSNGTFRMSWSPDQVLFEAARYGDGLGGMMRLKLPRDTSFDAVLDFLDY